MKRSTAGHGGGRKHTSRTAGTPRANRDTTQERPWRFELDLARRRLYVFGLRQSSNRGFRMDGVAARPASPRTIAPALLWAIRLASGLFFVLALLLSLFPELSSRRWIVDLPFFASLSLPALYGLALWFLRGNPPNKFGLALIIALGTVWSTLCLLGIVAWVLSATARPWLDWSELLGLVAILAVQGVYGATAARAYFRLGRERADWGRLAIGLVVAALVVSAFVWGIPHKIRSGPHYLPQASAVGSLRTINTAEITYASTYGGYSPTLAALGPPSQGEPPTAGAAGLIDEVLAGGVRSGYRFTFKPGPRDAKGQITSYTVCARPIKRSEPLLPSFFTDETGVVRRTDEDRCPTLQDPPHAG